MAELVKGQPSAQVMITESQKRVPGGAPGWSPRREPYTELRPSPCCRSLSLPPSQIKIKCFLKHFLSFFLFFFFKKLSEDPGAGRRHGRGGWSAPRGPC